MAAMLLAAEPEAAHFAVLAVRQGQAMDAALQPLLCLQLWSSLP